jgi:hypothetical protein
MEQLLVALLVIAGSWFILDRALKAAAEKEQKQKSLGGSEWASRVVKEIRDAQVHRTSPS